MKDIIKKILSSFDTNTPGYSGRKLTAFWTIVLVTYLHKFVDKNNAIEFLIVDYCAMALCLSLVTSEQLVRLRTGISVSETKSTPTTETTTETKINP